MSDKRTFIIQPAPHPARQNALRAVQEALEGQYVIIQDETRTQEQNRLLWPLLTLWAKFQKAMVNGEQIHVTKEAWKVIHLADFRHEHGVPGQFVLTPGGILVSLGYETHTMPKGEFKDFLTYLLAETSIKGMQLPPRVDYSDYLGRAA